MKHLLISTFSFFAFVSSAHSNYELNCFDTKIKNPKAAIVSAIAASNLSRRLISDVIETRSSTDTESLPSFLVSQYKADSSEIYLAVDDGSPSGLLIAELDVKAVGKKKGDKAIWRYQGTYKRFDAGRRLNLKVECAVTQ
jgi:hypothetical protein